MASPHLSIRVDARTLEQLDKASRRDGMSRSELAKTLIEEGLRMQTHPGIVFRPGPTGRRAALARGPDVWEVMNTFEDRDNPSEEGIAWASVCLTLSIYEIHDALAYYNNYKEEIEDRIRRNDEAAEEGYATWLSNQGVLSR
jgi:hypothetical protein